MKNFVRKNKKFKKVINNLLTINLFFKNIYYFFSSALMKIFSKNMLILRLISSYA